MKNSLIFPTNTDSAFSRRSSSCFCKSWMSPSTSMTSPALSKTQCDLYGVTTEINDESLNNLPPPKMDSQLIRPLKVPEGGNSSHKSFSAGVK
jgi:hypothetical protein